MIHGYNVAWTFDKYMESLVRAWAGDNPTYFKLLHDTGWMSDAEFDQRNNVLKALRATYPGNPAPDLEDCLVIMRSILETT